MDPKLVGKLKSASDLVVAKNKLSATLCIHITGDELNGVDEEVLQHFFKLNGITHGILPNAIADILSGIKNGFGEIGPLEIARGEAPKAGIEGDLILEFSQNLQVGETKYNGRMDYRERGVVHQVTEGQRLAEARLPVPGKPGRTIYNKEVPAPKLKVFKLPEAGAGVSYDEKTHVFAAAIAGNVDFEDNTLMVTPDFTVAGDVDFNVGNIHFSGNVIVAGTIQKGFVVEADGTVVIGGDVEAGAKVLGGRDVTIKGNCGGKGKGEQPNVRAGGNLSIHSMSEASVYAAGDVTVDGPIISSSVHCLGRFVSAGEEAEIRGCFIEAVSGITAQKVGTEDGQPNTLVTGITARVSERLEAINEELNKLTQHINHVSVSFEKRNEALLRKRELSAKEKETLKGEKEKANAKQEQLEEKARDLKAEKETLEDQYAERPGATIHVTGEMHPITNMVVFRHDYVLSAKPRQDTVFYDGERSVVCQSREEFEKQKRQKAADPEDLLTRFRQGALNPSQLFSGMEHYNASGSPLMAQTALGLGLKAVKVREYQNPSIWCETARSMVLVAQEVKDGAKRESFLKKAQGAAESALKLKRDAPGPQGIFGMIAVSRGDLRSALTHFRGAVDILQNSRKRVSFRNDEGLFAVYAQTLCNIAVNLHKKGKQAESRRFSKEAESMAKAYLAKQVKGAWADCARRVMDELERLKSPVTA